MTVTRLDKLLHQMKLPSPVTIDGHRVLRCVAVITSTVPTQAMFDLEGAGRVFAEIQADGETWRVVHQKPKGPSTS